MTPTDCARSIYSRLGRLVLRQSLRRTLVAVTALAVLGALAISESIVYFSGNQDYLVAAIASVTSALILAPLIGTAILRLLYALDATRQELLHVSSRDYLTGVANRRHFMSIARREWDTAQALDQEGALLMIDVDHFKRVNDTHGHPCGDNVLCEIARSIGGSLRGADLLGRYGGEEFIAFLPRSSLCAAVEVAERIRARVETATIEWQGTRVAATVSIGVAALDPHMESLDDAIREADFALYSAKARGRNRVLASAWAGASPAARDSDTDPRADKRASA